MRSRTSNPKVAGSSPAGRVFVGLGLSRFFRLKEPEFKAELDRQREKIAAEAFGVLSQSLTKAVETLVGLPL